MITRCARCLKIISGDSLFCEDCRVYLHKFFLIFRRGPRTPSEDFLDLDRIMVKKEKIKMIKRDFNNGKRLIKISSFLYAIAKMWEYYTEKKRVRLVEKVDRLKKELREIEMESKDPKIKEFSKRILYSAELINKVREIETKYEKYIIKK